MSANRVAQLAFGSTYRGTVGGKAMSIRTTVVPASVLRAGPAVVREMSRPLNATAGRRSISRAINAMPTWMRPIANTTDGTMVIYDRWTGGMQPGGLGCDRERDGSASNPLGCDYGYNFGRSDTHFHATQALAFAIWRAGLDDDTVSARFRTALRPGMRRAGRPSLAPCTGSVSPRCLDPQAQFVAEFMNARRMRLSRPYAQPVMSAREFRAFLTANYRLSAHHVNCKRFSACVR